MLDQHKVFRRLLIAYACAMTYIVVDWSMDFAGISELDGISIAAVIASIQAPIIAMNGYIAKLYIENSNRG